MVMLGKPATTGMGFTVTVICAEAEHPFASVPITVYEIVEDGLAVTDEPAVELNAVAGLQEYVLAPPAVRVTDCPAQIAAGLVTVTTGSGFTVTVTSSLWLHALDVPVTV